MNVIIGGQNDFEFFGKTKERKEERRYLIALIYHLLRRSIFFKGS